MPGGGTLGYDGDPNLVPTPPLGTPGENLLYYVAQGATYMESSGTWWRKSILPNHWDIVGAYSWCLDG